MESKKVHGEGKHLPRPSKIRLYSSYNIPVAILHSIFVKGETMSFELGEDDIKASGLYQDFEYTTIDQLLDIFLINPPKPCIWMSERLEEKRRNK